jgi:hypothetical protein
MHRLQLSSLEAVMKYFRPVFNVIAIIGLLMATSAYAQEIPAGSVISVRMIDPISSDRNYPGQVFRASLAAPVRINNRVFVPQGANATVRLVAAQSAERLHGHSELQLALDRVGGHPVRSYVVSYRGSSQTKKTLKSAGIGGAIGAGVGALFGGGTGAAFGGGLGAGAGVAQRAIRGPKAVYVPSESLVNFRLATPMRVR